jgi:hypothetical protein
MPSEYALESRWRGSRLPSDEYPKWTPWKRGMACPGCGERDYRPETLRFDNGGKANRLVCGACGSHLVSLEIKADRKVVRPARKHKPWRPAAPQHVEPGYDTSRFVVPAGVECFLRRVRQQFYGTVITRKESRFDDPVEEGRGYFVFEAAGWQLKIARFLVADRLKKG